MQGKQSWIRDLGLFTAILLAVPAVMLAGYLVFAGGPAVPILLGGACFLVAAWRRAEGGRAHRIATVAACLTLITLAVVCGPQLMLWLLIHVYGPS